VFTTTKFIYALKKERNTEIKEKQITIIIIIIIIKIIIIIIIIIINNDGTIFPLIAHITFLCPFLAALESV